MGLAEATAAEFLQRASIKEVAAALRDGADFSRRDSREIAVAILKEPIPTTTTLLADRVRAVSLEEEGYTGDDAVKRAMQALRIVVNGEFDALEELLVPTRTFWRRRRAVFLTFHSGEDRRVKKAQGGRRLRKRGRGGPRPSPEDARSGLQAAVVRAGSDSCVVSRKKQGTGRRTRGPRGGGRAFGHAAGRGGSWRRP